MYHSLTPLAFEDDWIRQRMLGVGVEKPNWIRTLRLSLCCHELVAWLLSERAGDEGKDCTCCLFTHTHRHRQTVEKRYRCQCNIGNGSIQSRHSGAPMLLDPCCITGGWQVFITLYKSSQHSGSSTSLASTKVCSSMDENDGPAEEVLEEGFQVPASIAERYKVGRTIGDGNFAIVKECIERSTGREYALKIIKKSKCRGKEHMIQNEVSILRRVKHPNIVLLIEEMDMPTELYLVMELVKGGDLFDAITSTNKYTERDASGMLYNLASAIKYLHSLNIVHRDIKPENLLVYEHQDGSKSLKLGDFGLATIVDGPLYTVCGTPTYVAPEIIAETGYGLKVDIWAAGVITYILLCGFPPFRGSGDDQEVLFDQILMGQVDFPSPYWDNVSDSAKELITMMLQVDVDLRFSALQVLEHPWVNDDGLPENEHQLSVAGKIKKHFNTGPKPNSTAAGVSVIALDHGFTIKRSGSLDYYQQPGMYWI
ncbi:PREDICTED: serine/threonine-protein kinase DCLK1-like, partial [Chlamydotis macqueenii]|uniref:serine/threonine-protein kinase DCLK1-like n=1 Tax=Chlamydotis macqueenii TaxID=187382 RepID=UPI00052A0A74